jgi:nucleoside 2-deoxyribosyltransferase
MKKIKIYLAASWSRKAEIADVAKELQKEGYIITSRWLNQEKVVKGISLEAFRRQRAKIDVADVKRADVLVRFSDDLSRKFVPSNLATGARMFETGLAYALGKKIIVVSGHQPIFDYLPTIMHVRHVSELKICLSGLK